MNDDPQASATHIVKRPVLATNAPAGEAVARRWVVLSGIAAVTALLLLSLGIIYWRSWVRRPQPSRMGATTRGG